MRCLKSLRIIAIFLGKKLLKYEIPAKTEILAFSPLTFIAISLFLFHPEEYVFPESLAKKKYLNYISDLNFLLTYRLWVILQATNLSY